MNPSRPTPLQVLTNLGKALCYLLLFLSSQMVLSMIATISISLSMASQDTLPADPDGMMEALMEQLLAYTPHITLFSALLTLVVLAILFAILRRNPLTSVTLRPVHPAVVLIGAAIAPMLYLVVVVALSLLPEAWVEAYDQATVGLDSTGVMAFLATALAAPVVEEVVFRGLILTRLNRVMPGWLAVVLSALVFGLCHGQAVWVGYAFVLGLTFGALTLRSRSILPAMACHIVFNTIGQLTTLLQQNPNAQLALLGSLVVVGAAAALILRPAVRRASARLNQSAPL